MQRILTLIAATLLAFSAGTVLAGKCCETAKAKGVACEKCAPSAAKAKCAACKDGVKCAKCASKAKCASCKDGVKCAKCAAKTAVKAGSCCGKAQAKGKSCKHPCCVKATAAGSVCKKCNS